MESVLIVPGFAEEQAVVYYNTAAVIDADGTYPGKFRHVWNCRTAIPGSGRSSTSGRATSAGYPVFDTRIGKWLAFISVMIATLPEARPLPRP